MSQADKICEYLRRGNSITQAEAAEMFGCWRLGARILELRRAGMPIETTMIRQTNEEGEITRYARYWLRK